MVGWCPVQTSALFSLLASVLALDYHFSRSEHCEEHIETAFTRRIFCFHLVLFLNITNYKVVTGPVASGSKFLLVQKHFALVQD